MVYPWYLLRHRHFTTHRLGAVYGPIKTQFGYHLLQVVERSEKSA